MPDLFKKMARIFMVVTLAMHVTCAQGAAKTALKSAIRPGTQPVAGAAEARCRCYSPGATGPLSVLVFPKGVNRVVIKLHREGDTLLTNAVRINGKKAGWFSVDTGSYWTELNSRNKHFAHLPVVISNKVMQHADRYDVRFENSISVGPVKLLNHAAIRSKLGNSPKALPVPLAGILGSDFWGKLPFTINYQKNELILYRPAAFRPPAKAVNNPITLSKGLKPINIRFGHADPDAGLPTVKGMLDGIKCNAILDTGSTGPGLILTAGFTKAHPQMVNRALGPLPTIVTLSKDGVAFPAKIKQLNVLGSRFTRSIQHSMGFVMVEGERYSRQSDNQRIRFVVLGAGILKRYRLTFDYAMHRVWLQKVSPVSMAQQLARGLNPNHADLCGETALMRACLRGDIRAVKELLKAGANPQALAFGNYSVLYEAVSSENVGLVKLLLKTAAKSDVNKARSNGVTPLEQAIVDRDLPMATLLLQAGADINARRGSGRTTLILAAQHGDLAIIKSLIAAKADLNAVTKGHATPLNAAAYGGHIRAFKMLLKAGAKMAVAPSGYTLLHAAATGGHVRMIQYLLDHTDQRRNLNRPTDDGVTPLMLAAWKAHLAACRVLVAAGAVVKVDNNPHLNGSPLVVAAQTDDVPLIQFLVQHGARVNAVVKLKSGTEVVPLYMAAENGNNRSVAMLLHLGAKVNMRLPHGLVPLMGATFRGHTEAARLLIGHGANVNAATSAKAYHLTPLMLTAQHGDPELINLLIKHGANINAQRLPGGTALMLAANYDKTGNLCALLCHGANANDRMPTGLCSLHLAAMRGDIQIAGNLLRAGAKVNAPGPGGATPLDVACGEGHINMVKLLLAAGANPKLPDNQGNKAHYYAIKGGHMRIINLLYNWGRDHRKPPGTPQIVKKGT